MIDHIKSRPQIAANHMRSRSPVLPFMVKNGSPSVSLVSPSRSQQSSPSLQHTHLSHSNSSASIALKNTPFLPLFHYTLKHTLCISLSPGNVCVTLSLPRLPSTLLFKSAGQDRSGFLLKYLTD